MGHNKNANARLGIICRVVLFVGGGSSRAARSVVTRTFDSPEMKVAKLEARSLAGMAPW